MCVLAGMGLNGFNGDDQLAANSMLYYPSSVQFDPEDRLVIVDFNNMRLRRLEEDGTLLTIAGSGEHNWSIDGTPFLESPLENPIDAAFLEDGTFYILPLHEQRVIYIGEDQTVQQYAGSGEEGYGGDGGPALEATMSQSCGMELAGDGTLYIADTENHAIRAVTPDGVIDTVAGCGEAGFADGPVGEGCLNTPQRMSIAGGALYITDMYNHALRRLDLTTLELETVVGDGTAGFAGDGGPAADAWLNSPTGVDALDDGTLYIADSQNNVIRRVSPDGTIDTVAGTLTGGFVLAGGPATETPLSFPGDVAVSPEGDLIIADMFNGAIQRVTGPIP